MKNSSPDLITEEQLRRLFQQALFGQDRLKMLTGFKLDNPSISKKLFFSATCKCGTAALLSVEVSENKTLEQVKEALPALLAKLRGQASVFYNMSCEAHASMRRAQFLSTGSSERA